MHNFVLRCVDGSRPFSNIHTGNFADFITDEAPESLILINDRLYTQIGFFHGLA
jgi:hypothetical protein